MKVDVDYDKNTCTDACKNVCPNRRLLIAIGEGNYDGVLNFEAFMDYEPKESGQVKTEMKLFCFRGSPTTQNILDRINTEGYRPAELFELLAFGAKYPEIQRKFTIVALGTSASKNRFTYTPCLTGDTDVRRLETTWNVEEKDYSWEHIEKYRFLAIQKSLPSNS